MCVLALCDISRHHEEVTEEILLVRVSETDFRAWLQPLPRLALVAFHFLDTR